MWWDYNDYKDNGKTMNFKLDDDSQGKIYNIFWHIEEKLKIDLSDFTYVSEGKEHLKTKVSSETYFTKNNKNNIIPNENTKYKCRVVLQIQSVYYSMNDKDIKFYPQVLVEQCSYKTFSNNVLIHPDLKFTDSEPDSESNDSDESEDTV